MQAVIGGSVRYPNLQSIADLFRSGINDTFNNTGGSGTGSGNSAGLIMPNSNPDLLTFMDSAIQELYSDLRNVGDPELILDNYIVFGIPPLTQVNPAVQVSLAYQGYFDGFQWHPEWKLPISVSKMLAMWERQGAGPTTSTTITYAPPLENDYSANYDPNQGSGFGLSTDIPHRVYVPINPGDVLDSFTGFQNSGIIFITFYNSANTSLLVVDVGTATTVTAPTGSTYFLISADSATLDSHNVQFNINTNNNVVYSIVSNGGNFETDFSTAVEDDPLGMGIGRWFASATPQSTFFLVPGGTLSPGLVLHFYDSTLSIISSIDLETTLGVTYTAPENTAFWSVEYTLTDPDTGSGLELMISRATSSGSISIPGESQDNFVPMRPAPFGLPGVQQGQSMSIWEMRNGQIWMPGCLTYRDLRIRARITYPVPFGPNINFATTYVPILDSRNAIVAKMLILYAKRFAPEQYPMAISEEDRLMQKLKLEVVRQLQAQENQRSEFGAEAVQDFAISYNWL